MINDTNKSRRDPSCPGSVSSALLLVLQVSDGCRGDSPDSYTHIIMTHLETNLNCLSQIQILMIKPDRVKNVEMLLV